MSHLIGINNVCKDIWFSLQAKRIKLLTNTLRNVQMWHLLGSVLSPSVMKHIREVNINV